MTDRIMSCDSCRELLSARSDGEAGAGDEAAVRAHLATCAACREYQDDLGTVRSALRGWVDELPPAASHPFGSGVRRQNLTFRRLAAAAVFVVAIAVGFAGGRATAPGATRNDASTIVDPAVTPPVERDRYFVPERNEIHSTISLAFFDRSQP